MYITSTCCVEWCRRVSWKCWVERKHIKWGKEKWTRERTQTKLSRIYTLAERSNCEGWVGEYTQGMRLEWVEKRFYAFHKQNLVLYFTQSLDFSISFALMRSISPSNDRGLRASETELSRKGKQSAATT